MKKWFFRILLVLTLLFILLLLFNWSAVKKLKHAITLFDEDVIVQNFQDMEETFPVKELHRSSSPKKLPSLDIGFKPIENFTFQDSIFSFKEYIRDTRTEGLLVIQNDTIIYENYYNDQFKGTGYDQVAIEDLLQMSSGVRFNEDYGDFNSDINKFGRAFAMGSSLESFAQSLERDRPPGTFNHYVSIDTQVLGILLIKLTGKSITELSQEWIWEPMGFEHDGQWITDNKGLEMALGGLNCSMRDYAKMGLLYLNKGQYNGTQILSEEWVEKSLETSKAHLKPNQTELSSNHHGYGYQWWIPQHDEGDFFMVGIYNQFVYVQPKHDLVIVKLSANHHFKKEGKITKDIHLAMFKAMAEDFDHQENQEL